MSSKNNVVPAIVAGLLALVAVLLLMLLNGTDKQAMQPAAVSERWQTVAPMNYARRALAATVYNDYVYAVGGVDGEGHYVKEVEYAHIDKQGRLSRWQRTSALNQGRFYLATVAVDGWLYALGGGSGPLGDDNRPLASVERARINADGSLQNWQIISHMTTPRRGLKAVVYHNTLYAIGGYNGQFLKSIERTAIDAQGLPGQWLTEVHESIVDRYIHSATRAGQYMVLLGGHMRNPDTVSYGDVEVAAINDDRSVGPWRVSESSLLTPRFMASALALNQYIYMFGGHNGSQRLASVEYASINPFGEVSPWQTTLPLSQQRSAAAVVSYDDYVLVLGGIGDGIVWNSVELARQQADGRLSNPGQI